MDPESWKMATTNFKFLNQRNDSTTPKTLQVYHGKYLTTERLVKRTSNILRKEESPKLEGRYIHANRKASYGHGLVPVEQGEIKKYCSEEMRSTNINKYNINKWEVVPSQTDCRANVVHSTYSKGSKNSKSPFGVDIKRSPAQTRDVSRIIIPQREKTNFQHFRDNGKVDASSCTDAKDSVSVLCNRTKVPGGTNTIINDSLLQDNEEFPSDDSSVYLQIPLHHSLKRIMEKHNVPHCSDTSDPGKRMKMGDQEASVRSVTTVHQKKFDQHCLPYKEIPTVSGAFTHADSVKTVACRDTVNRIQREKFRNSLIDKTKGDTSVSNQKDKPSGNSTYRRFLLIDSQGLPYTVVVEDPNSTKLSNPTKESSSDNAHGGVAKSLAPRKVYKCPVCFRIFEYLSYLQRHSIAHSQQKPHVCKICGKAFKRTSHLTRHKYTHFGGKPCQCQICQRRFRDANELARHQQQSHPEERPHRCDICNMRFGEHSTLQHHMLTKHMK